MTTSSERYVASRDGAIRLVKDLPSVEMPASTKDQDPMAKAKKPRVRHSRETIDGVLARLAAGETGAAISRDTAISEGTISLWKKQGNKAAKKVAKRAAVATNGHAAPAGDGLPTLELKGLRAWVSKAVRDELAPVRKQLQNLVDAMDKVP